MRAGASSASAPTSWPPSKGSSRACASRTTAAAARCPASKRDWRRARWTPPAPRVVGAPLGIASRGQAVYRCVIIWWYAAGDPARSCATCRTWCAWAPGHEPARLGVHGTPARGGRAGRRCHRRQPGQPAQDAGRSRPLRLHQRPHPAPFDPQGRPGRPRARAAGRAGRRADVFLGQPQGRSGPRAAMLGAALDRLKASGELDRIHARWAGRP
jgi:hypothetical protein